MRYSTSVPASTPYGPALFREQVPPGPVWACTAPKSVAVYMIEITYADVHISKETRKLARLHWPFRPDGNAWLCWANKDHSDVPLLWEHDPLFDYFRDMMALSTVQLRTNLERAMQAYYPELLQQYQEGFSRHE